jgi:Rieske Fe-S protein
MPAVDRRRWIRSRPQRVQIGCPTLAAQAVCSHRLEEHTCAARCPLPWVRDGESCTHVARNRGDGTVDRSRFLRLGALAVGATLTGATGSLGGLLSPAPNALAAGKAKLAVAGTGLWLGNARSLTPSQALTYTDPGSGDPALLLRLANGQYVSFDAGCTHGLCTVEYDTRQHLMICPCHGATFDPAHGGAVLVGPAKDPLYQLRIQVDASGDVYYLNAPAGPRVNRLKTAPPYTGQTGDDGGDGGVSGGQGGEGNDGVRRPLSRQVKARHLSQHVKVQHMQSAHDE